MLLKTLAEILGSGRYVERLNCLTADPFIVTLYTVSGLVIGASFIAIASCLWLQRENGLRLTGAQCALTAILVGLLAVTHLMDVVLIYQSLYRLDVVVRGLVAGISATIAISIAKQCRKGMLA